VDRRWQQPHRPKQPLLGQLAARDDAFSVPDAFVCGADTGNVQAGCDPDKISTSHRNKFYENVMGISPNGKPDPNGLDFWWDDFADNKNNCWYDNIGSNGKASGITSSPTPLPSNCKTSVGKGNSAQESELLDCFAAADSRGPSCAWFTTPVEPKP